nr:MAG TPA: replisome organizer protein [Caudoviricetes sp.]
MILNVKNSYYAVIPATVRYDNNVVPSAKLLYGEITALCNEKGYCWATNDYFGRLYSVSKRTISTWIKSLCDAGYISTEFILDNESQKVKVRCLKVVEKNFVALTKETSGPPRSRLREPHEENFAENNTLNNTFNISSSQIFEKSKINDERVKKKKVFEADSEAYLLAKFLERCITENNPKFPQNERQRQRWAKDFDLMLRIDKIDADDIAAIIEWSQDDNFWRSNILSGKKLREKYQQLAMKMNSRK